VVRLFGGAGRGAQRKRHRPIEHGDAVYARDALQQPHAAPQADNVRLDDDHVAGDDGATVADALDAGEERDAQPVLGFGENEDRPDLGGRTGEPPVVCDR
jgi:hypothetical protein